MINYDEKKNGIYSAPRPVMQGFYKHQIKYNFNF